MYDSEYAGSLPIIYCACIEAAAVGEGVSAVAPEPYIGKHPIVYSVFSAMEFGQHPISM